MKTSNNLPRVGNGRTAQTRKLMDASALEPMVDGWQNCLGKT